MATSMSNLPRVKRAIKSALRLLIASSMIWSISCASADSCQKISEQCVEGAATRDVAGVPVHRPCWRFESVYECVQEGKANDCAPLRARGCAQIGSTCIARASNGVCLTYEQNYHCPDKPARTTTRTVCDTSTFCQDGDKACFDTSAPPDKDFGKAAAMLEVSRQAGVYGGDKQIEIFKGYEERCSIKTVGGTTIKSCCSSSAGGSTYTNHAVFNVAARTGSVMAKETVKRGSKYVYDTLYQNMDKGLLKQGLGAITGWSDPSGIPKLGSTLNLYGFSFTFTFANGFQFVAFDPYSFAAQIALMLIQKWLSCDTKEQTMSVKRGQNLCSHVSTQCRKKVLSICIEREQMHCCFNSKLAKLVNRQGRAQLGLPLDQCGGFSESQLQRLDFEKIDLSEFIADMVPNEEDSDTIVDRANKHIRKKNAGNPL